MATFNIHFSNNFIFITILITITVLNGYKVHKKTLRNLSPVHYNSGIIYQSFTTHKVWRTSKVAWMILKTM